MRGSGWGRLALLCAVVSGPAAAQVVWDAPNVIIQPPSFGTKGVKARPEAWPRLDPGATLCKTEADLLRLAGARRGEPGPQPNCRPIRVATPIVITRRAGVGRTLVSLTDTTNQEGWTDAWLPEKAPPIGGKGVSIR